MFSTDFIFRQQENLFDNKKYQAGFRPLCNKILLFLPGWSGQKSGVQFLCPKGPQVNLNYLVCKADGL